MSHSPSYRSLYLLPVLVLLAGCERDITPPDSLAAGPPHRAQATTPTVTNLNDDGPGSLRAAIAAATNGETIRFDGTLAGQTIPLSSVLDIADKTITIEGPAAKITLSGGGQHQVMHIGATANVVLRNLSIIGGYALELGAGIGNEGTLRLENCLVDANTVLRFAGGIWNYGSLTLVNSTVSGNYADNGGGIGNAGSLAIANSTIASNRAVTNGAGIFSLTGISLTNSTVSDNLAGGRGGGIMVCCGVDVSPTISLVHTTVVFNRGGYEGGAGLWIQSTADNSAFYTFDSQYSIVAHNTENLTTYLANCVMQDALMGPGTTNTPNVTNSGVPCVFSWIWDDRLLGPLDDNGGPTKTHALLRDSRAIDAAVGSTIAVDQRYVSRPVGRARDLGAVEFDGTPTVTLTIDGAGQVDPNTGVATVTGTIRCLDPVAIVVQVALSQDQKAKKVPTRIDASGPMGISCSTPGGAWSMALTPATGAFENGKASASIEMLPQEDPLPWVTPATASADLMLGWAKK